MENNLHPTQSLYYRQFDTCIRFKDLPSNFTFNYNRMNQDGSQIWRGVRKTNRLSRQSERTYNYNLYTSDQSLVSQIKADSFLSNKIEKMFVPVSEAHRKILYEKDRSIILREKLWYHTYKHKLVTWPKLRFTENSKSVESTIKWIYDNFNIDDRRIVHNSSWFFRHESVPIVFCNSEETMMLYKLAWSNDYEIRIETVIPYKELRN